MKKKSSSRRWLQEHFNDPYVKQAQAAGYRARSTFKLLELQERDKLFKQGMTVIDLGAAPGGWSQIIPRYVGKHGRIVALDILPMEPIKSVEFVQGDFTDQAVLDALLTLISGQKIDWVISDMSPNKSGIESVDQARAMELAELALDFANTVLVKEGGLLIKLFQGEGFDEFLLNLRRHFTKVTIRKPKASRDRSREVYILAKK